MGTFIENHRTYTKINTLYRRYTEGPLKNQIIIGNYSRPEFELLRENEWEAYEKIDGTNISYFYDGEILEIHGKTANANIPVHLEEKLRKLVTLEMMKEVFPPFDEFGNKKTFSIRIYGEGYGMKIQNGSNYIPDDVNFIVFDICINEYWLDRDNIVDICNKLNLQVVPYCGTMTLTKAEELVKKGFSSSIANNKNYEAEGLVLRPKIQLFNRKGERIMVKIKTVDYRNIEKRMNYGKNYIF